MIVRDWVEVGRIEDLPPGEALRAVIGDVPVAVFNVLGTLHCVDDTCTHELASLSDGDIDIERGTVECPLHGSAFDLRTGDAVSLPAVEPVRVHHVEVADGMIRVCLGE
jgi:3-phenylpropionate/trans-cinnamate dioxygenase ferredoxin subunit